MNPFAGTGRGQAPAQGNRQNNEGRAL